MAILDLEQQLIFYGSYHSHPKNIYIHLLFIPVLMFGLFAYSSFAFSASHPYLLNLSTITSFVYSSLYILMEPVAGGLFTPFVIGQSLLGSYMTQNYDRGTVVLWVTASQVVGWVAQLIGHGVYEKRAPALKENLVQALFLAPLFAWIEWLWMGGYRPELRARVDVGVKRRKAEMDAKKQR